MRFRRITLLIIVLAVASVASGQDRDKPTSAVPVSFQEILRAFQFPSKANRSLEEISNDLIGRIKERRVNFLLDDAAIFKLKSAGPNLELLSIIDTYIVPREVTVQVDSSTLIQQKKERLRKQIALYDKIIEIWQRKKQFEDWKALIKLGEEYLEKFGSDSDAKEMSDYLRNNIPKWKTRISQLKTSY